MSKEQKTITCLYCKAENAKDATVCSKCGRIIQAREKAPFDYRPIAAWIAVLTIIATITGIVLFVRNHWTEYWYKFQSWCSNNENSASFTLFLAVIIITTIIACKFSKAKTFGSIYWTSCIIMLTLTLIIDSLGSWITGEAFPNIFSTIFAVLVLNLVPSAFAKIIRSVMDET